MNSDKKNVLQAIGGIAGGMLIALTVTAQAPPTYENVASTMQIMHTMVIPSSNALFDVGSKEPKNDAEWSILRDQAVVLAESANLLLMPGRATPVLPGKGKSIGKGAALSPDWVKASRMLRTAGKTAVSAIDKRDVDTLLGDVGDQILMSCSTCHETYLKK